MLRIASLAVAVSMLLAACSSGIDKNDFATTLGAPDVRMPILAEEAYRIGPQDRLSISVFQNRDLSVDKAQVDATGLILLPLVGSVSAAGKTTAELSTEISRKLTACCLQNPQVMVQVEDAVSQQVTVTGAVKEAGVYVLRGRTTLIQAISMAKGADKDTANIRRVAVYRYTGGQRTGALFDLKAINNGKAEDPEIFGGDTIVVDTSSSKGVWRSMVTAVPFIGIFAAF